MGSVPIIHADSDKGLPFLSYDVSKKITAQGTFNLYAEGFASTVHNYPMDPAVSSEKSYSFDVDQYYPSSSGMIVTRTKSDTASAYYYCHKVFDETWEVVAEADADASLLTGFTITTNGGSVDVSIASQCSHGTYAATSSWIINPNVPPPPLPVSANTYAEDWTSEPLTMEIPFTINRQCYLSIVQAYMQISPIEWEQYEGDFWTEADASASGIWQLQNSDGELIFLNNVPIDGCYNVNTWDVHRDSWQIEHGSRNSFLIPPGDYKLYVRYETGSHLALGVGTNYALFKDYLNGDMMKLQLKFGSLPIPPLIPPGSIPR